MGLFLGNWLHNEVVGDVWTKWVTDCLEAGSFGTLEHQACSAPVERLRAVWTTGGAVVVLVLGLTIMAVVPSIVRRRRSLRPVSNNHSALSARFAELSASMGLRRTPVLLMGPLRQRDAFALGSFGRYTVAIPRGLAVRVADEWAFDGVVRHELSHIRNHDVPFSWLARSIWYIVVPCLAIPLAWSVVSVDTSLIIDFLPRAALLAVVVWAAAAGLLRAREIEADLTAARGDPHELALVLHAVEQARDRPGRGWAGAAHPSVAHRLAALRAPQVATIVRFADDAVACALVAFTVPVITQAMVTASTGGPVVWARVIEALIAGVLLGCSVGIGVWRNVFARTVSRSIDPTVGVGAPYASAVAGLLVGLLAGGFASLSHVGIPATQWLSTSALAIPIACAAALALSGSFAQVWVDSSPALRTARGSRSIALGVNIALFSTVWWLSATIQVVVDGFTWATVLALGPFFIGTVPIALMVAMLLTAATIGLALRRRTAGHPAPAWWFDGPLTTRLDAIPLGFKVPGATPAVVTGLAAGVACAVVLTLYWVMVEAPAGTPVQNFDTRIIWVAAVAAGGFSLVAALLLPRVGPSVGLAGGVIASCVAATMTSIMTGLVSGSLEIALRPDILPAAAACGALLAVIAGLPDAFIPSGSAPMRSRPFAALAAVPAAMVLLATVISPALGVPAKLDNPSAGPSDADIKELDTYAAESAPAYVRTWYVLRSATGEASAAFLDDPGGVVAYLRDEVLPEYHAFSIVLEAQLPTFPDLALVHDRLRDAVAGMTVAVETCVAARNFDACTVTLGELTSSTDLAEEWAIEIGRLREAAITQEVP